MNPLLKSFHKSIPLLVLLGIAPAVSSAQKIKSEDVTYQYAHLPLQPLPKSIKNYTVTFEAPYEEKNRVLTDEYQNSLKAAALKYKEETAGYPALVKAAETKYETELAAYNKKTFGEKFVEHNILKENNKPVKQPPPVPVLQVIQKPALQTSYDLKVLAATYLHLDGYEQHVQDAVRIIVTLYGYDYSQPRTLSEQKDMIRTGGGNTTTYKATYYHTEFSYRHPMAVKILLPDGKEILNTTPNELSIYKMYSSAASDNYTQFNAEPLIKINEEKILQENLTFLNSLVNDKFGFGLMKRNTSLSYVKNRSEEYTDLTTAFNEASTGLTMLGLDATNAKVKLQKAIAIWNTALQESDVNNKKARIDKEVTIAICFNMLETFFALSNVSDGIGVISRLNGFNLSGSERQRKNNYELLFADLTNRIKVNQ